MGYGEQDPSKALLERRDRLQQVPLCLGFLSPQCIFTYPGKAVFLNVGTMESLGHKGHAWLIPCPSGLQSWVVRACSS